MFEQKIFDSKTLVPKAEGVLVPEPLPRAPYDPRQRRLMVVALALLLVALGFILYRDRDFWFPDTQEADSAQPAEAPPAANTSAQPSSIAKATTPSIPAKRHTANTKTEPKPTPPATTAAPVNTSATRTVLPPLEVEVIAGDTHSTVRPGSNSVRVDLQPGSPPQAASDGSNSGTVAETAANLTSNAAERVQMSADTAQIVSRPVNPGYPLLARQMKVQGSVILQALISKDGTIQDLRVLSGPPILASAAQTAVRQWHFKPHFLGTEAVETQAKITVNFTISTN
jgi:periplasmic protein TonB